ncbi:carbonic anhydrase [Mycena floridula]|nr:carbonic anhydrase [Mycena floridula]
MVLSALLVACLGLGGVLAHPFHQHFVRDLSRRQNEFDVLVQGNQQFRTEIESTNAVLLSTLAKDGQSPPFMFLGCSDSRVSEGTVFNANPGTLFTERNIANQFRSSDNNAYSVVSYAISVLGVRHLIVMGHYGCGGIAAAIASPPPAPVSAADAVVQAWVGPIRELFASSSRAEIVELREKLKGETVIEEPDINEPGFRALVEENVKAGVERIVKTSALKNHFELLKVANATRAREESAVLEDIFVHGWVYDIANGEIKDLGISVGPPGVSIPEIPFAKLQAAENNNVEVKVESNDKVKVGSNAEVKVENKVEAVENSSSSEHESMMVKKRCGEICSSKLKLRGL